MASVTAFFVPGIPAPQGSKRPIGRRGGGKIIMVESSPTVKPWRQIIGRTAVESGITPLDPGVPCLVHLHFVMPRPKSERKATRPHTKRPDFDKLSRAVLDALTGVAYHDDSQVVGFGPSAKRTAEPGELGGVHIGIERLAGDLTDYDGLVYAPTGGAWVL